jgi:hypothetical protein
MKPEEFFNCVRAAIDERFHCPAQGAFLTHTETHHDGRESSFSIRASCKMIAFSLDKRGLNPFPILNTSEAGLSAKNDLTVICESGGHIYVFVIEYKNAGNPGKAQHQIECGAAFCEYLFTLLRYCYDVNITPRILGVAAYRPQKGKTTPRIKFSAQGQHGLLRANWLIENPLPLSELVRAAEQCWPSAS